MNFFGIGLPELAVIAAIGLLVFGPKRLPELGKTLGKTLRGFQSASSEFEQEFRSAMNGAGSAAIADASEVQPQPEPKAIPAHPVSSVSAESFAPAVAPEAIAEVASAESDRPHP